MISMIVLDHKRNITAETLWRSREASEPNNTVAIKTRQYKPTYSKHNIARLDTHAENEVIGMWKSSIKEVKVRIK